MRYTRVYLALDYFAILKRAILSDEHLKKKLALMYTHFCADSTLFRATSYLENLKIILSIA